MNVIKKSRSEVKEALRCMGAGACALAMLVTMGCWGETPPASTQPIVAVGGKVVQGAVSGATVFADRLDVGSRFVLDPDEFHTTTDAQGNFQLTVPYGNYILVSTGGTDTLTHEPAITMMAPAGASNVSALTTLVALNPGLQSKIEALGVKYDTDLTASATPAALLLAKSVEAVVQSLTDAIASQVTLNPSQQANLQLQVLDNLASGLANSAVTSTTLSTPSQLQAVVNSAVTSALADIQLNNGSIGITNTAALATAVSSTVTEMAAAINPTATTTSPFSTSASSAAPEQSQLNVVAANNAITTATQQGGQQVQSVTDTTAPTVSSVSPADGSVGIQYSTFSAVFSEGMTPTSVDNATVTLSYAGGVVPGVVTYNPLTRTVTFTPNVRLQINTPYTATITTSVTDLAGNHMAANKVWHYTTTLSGSSGGTVPF